MKIEELKKLTQKELHKKLAESREKLRDLRFKVSSKQLKNMREIREARKLIARILTFLKKESKKLDNKN